MAATKNRTKAEREAQLGLVADLFCRGVRQVDIAEQVGVAPSQISYDLRILMGRWERDATNKIDAWKAQELEKINHLEREYWRAWLDSCGSAVKVSKEKKLGADVVTQRQEVESPSGDPRYLSGVQWCIDRRCKLLGLDAPTKQEISGKGGGAVALEIVERIVDGGTIAADDRPAPDTEGVSR